VKQDIASHEDIVLVVDSFYDKVRKDDLLGNIFAKIIGEDWSHHLPVMYRFWETILLNKPGYTGNPIRKHIDVDKQVLLELPHYNRWLQLWSETIDMLFSGTVADEAKNRASLMMNLIRIKVESARLGKNIL
jgi:hemoglobin